MLIFNRIAKLLLISSAAMNFVRANKRPKIRMVAKYATLPTSQPPVHPSLIKPPLSSFKYEKRKKDKIRNRNTQLQIPERKIGSMFSLGLSKGDKEADLEPQADEHEGWGGNQYHKHIYTIKEAKKEEKRDSGWGSGGGSSGSSVSDFLLGALSFLSLGSFLLNLLSALLSLFGNTFTTTMTYPVTPTDTATSTATTTGTTFAGSGGLFNSMTNYFRSGLKGGKRKRRGKKKGKIQAQAVVSNGNQDEDEDPYYDFDDDNEDTGVAYKTDNAAYDISLRHRVRKARSVWVPTVHPYTSLDVAARSVLNSIESMHNKYECMERVICDSNRYGKIIAHGLEYFMPIFTFSSSYYGRRLGFHQKMPEHLRAIILGIEEANCKSNFPRCKHIED